MISKKIGKNIDTINDGYLCSTCDPFLLLIAYLFQITINHRYNNHFIIYKSKMDVSKKVLEFRSDHGHFWKL